jgi:5-formyltetrahydrofolate cyclo-ligase
VRDDELVDDLPAEPHDVRMTHVLTPRDGLAALGPRSPGMPNTT